MNRYEITIKKFPEGNILLKETIERELNKYEFAFSNIPDNWFYRNRELRKIKYEETEVSMAIEKIE